VEKLIAESSVNVWFGQWGAKKTWAAIDLAVCVASGKQWLGMATEPCNVLIIDEESGDTRLANRIKDTMRGELGQMANASVPIKSVSLAQFNLLKRPDDADLLARLVLELDAKLIIIDALADVMLGGDENAVKDTQPVFANLRFIAELTGAAFIVIHHANKGGGYRGSSAIAGAIDTLLSVESKQDNSLITFKTEKMRDGEPLNFACEANWTDEGFYLTQSEITERAFLSKSQQYVLDFFTEKGDAKFADLLNFTGDLYAENTLRKAVQYLINEKLLERKDDGGQRVEAIYGIKRC
jgi:RecA-family ATPase